MMLIVAVQPGKSFHDVEEVYTSNTPRLAISGWFHIPQEGEPGFKSLNSSQETNAMSSLEQLTSIAEDKIWSFTPLPETKEYTFDADDLEFLSKWINEVYLTPDVVDQLHESMTDESLLQLPDFLTETVAKSLHSHLSRQDKTPTQSGWETAGPPHKQRFRYSRTISPEHNLLDLFEHPSFHKWLYHATGLQLSSQRAIARHFRAGWDYTLATEPTSTSSHLEATLNLTPSALRPKPSRVQGISARAVLSKKETGWSTGEFGGYEVYLAPSGDDDPAVYKDDDDGVLVSSDASWNVLQLVLRDTGVLKFVKYVSRSAWGGRWDVTSEWVVNDDSTDDNTEVNDAEQNDADQNGDVDKGEGGIADDEEWQGIP
jgi:prolyl 3-hydroxylase /prolyl 3,4-dihydroxylase